MTPETYAKLLKDLQKIQKKLVIEYVATVRGSEALQALMAERHKASETGGRLDDFVKLAARRSAVQLLLRTVYVRVLEDLGALRPVRIRGDWGLAAFREVAPALRVRSYLAWTFRDLAVDFPALFTPGPDELPLPSEDLCQTLWELWHRDDGRGHLVYEWQNGDGEGQGDGGFDSRFLGDLYQDLDKEVRKRYALLQTPEFVESYILDHTLTPALDEFDPSDLRDRGETFRLIDPTCGSGHFLIGAFHRLADYWEGKGLESWDAAERALESVWGCDINPHAVDIARFRLLLEVRARTGVVDLERWAGLKLNLRAMDSLIPWERLREGQRELFPGHDRLSTYGTNGGRRLSAEFLSRDFHAVVGNPPYITPKDKKKNADYRTFWSESATRKYAMSAPFVERLLALGTPDAFVGQITANSFMKREFGKGLVETVLRRWDLVRVVDASGAYIPGHGTPTVILFMRSRAETGEKVECVLGIKGEPKRPERPERGFVWSAIRAFDDDPGAESAFVSFDARSPEIFHQHPWSLGGGRNKEVADELESGCDFLLSNSIESIGVDTITRASELIEMPARSYCRLGVEPSAVRDYICGEDIRDFNFSPRLLIPVPYDDDLELIDIADLPGLGRFLWRDRSWLARRWVSGGTRMSDVGLPFHALPQFPKGKHKTPDAITFAFVATHNHFVLDRGGKVFKQSAPVIKLPPDATEEDHLELLGLLNSSTLGFWMRQVFHSKGAQGVGEGIKTEPWEQFFEYDSTKLKKAPITDSDSALRTTLARELDWVATARSQLLPIHVLERDAWTGSDLADRLSTARSQYRHLTHRMFALQEELDWLTYHSYGLVDEDLSVGPDEVEALAPGHRPFEILFARQDEKADPEERSAWWERHGHDKVTEIPDHYGAEHRARIRRRMEVIESNPRIALLEQPAYKRRWQTPDLHKEAVKAAGSWLLDRLEDLFAPAADDDPDGPLSTPRPYRLEEVVSAWQRDPRVAAAARVWAGTGDVDLTLVAEKLLQDNALPDNPYRLYTAEGLRKLDAWKKTWHLQDLEDSEQPLVDPDTGASLDEIPLPPKYVKKDFSTPRAFQIRGKLDVPRERFVLYADLTPPHYGWNGWRDRARALAQVAAYTRAESDPHDPLPPPTAEDPRRCGPTLGLWSSLPDVRRWSDPSDHAELQALAQEVCDQPTCPCALLERWQAWQSGNLEITRSTGDTATATAEVTVEERATVSRALILFGDRGATLAELRNRWPGSPARLQRVLDDLMASGDLGVQGRGKGKRFGIKAS